jgi:hypothetical protein
MKTDFKKKYFKLKKEYKDLLKFHEVISEFQGTAIVENKINLSHQDMSEVLSNVMKLDESIKKSNRGSLNRLNKIVKGLYYKYKYYLKYTKFRAFMTWTKYALVLTTSSNVLYAVYNKIVNGEFTLDLFLVIGQILLSMF